jgi:lipopolysaccharide biosynthesis glycosyltransferase
MPYFPENNVPIVMASSEFFLPYAGVTIQSIIEHSSPDYNYDIILLNTGYSERAIQLLHRVVADHPNFSIRLLNVGSYVSKLKFNIVGHVRQETFYRLLVPELFRNYQKIVYLDSDLIVCEDVEHLFHIDMQDNLIAAVYDADFIGEYNGASPAMKTYCDEKLRLEDPYSYVQAGVLVFNVPAMKNTFQESELIEFASGKTLNFVDQDVLNCKCSGRVQFLDMRWNVVTDCGGYRVNQLIRRAPLRIYQEYMCSLKEPKIIHYSGFEKPWTNPYSDMAEIYWNYARKSLFYELIIYRMINDVAHGSSNQTLGYRLKNIGKRILNLCFPKNTQRREELKKIYFKLFRHA